MATLIRDDVRVVAKLDGIVTETLNRARLTLGYDPENNQNALAESTAKAHTLFKRLGIEQFTPESVTRYKEQKLTKANRAARFHNFCDGAGIPISILSILGGAIAILIGVVSWLDGGHPLIDSVAWWNIAGFPLLAVGIYLCWYGFRSDIPEFEWNRIPIQKYKDEVPLFALSRATEIKRECPEADIYIEALQFRRMTGDPFLAVSIDGYLYYVDVWDEPSFEGRKAK